MDSESSSNPFVFASALEEGRAQELQMVSASEPNSTSAANPSVNPNTERNNRIYTVENLSDQDVTITWVQPTIVMACSSLLALLGISYIKNKGKLRPETLFGEPMSFDLFLTVLMLSFYFAVNGAIFSKKSPDISRASTLIALIGAGDSRRIKYDLEATLLSLTCSMIHPSMVFCASLNIFTTVQVGYLLVTFSFYAYILLFLQSACKSLFYLFVVNEG